jgi:hypothetical protein
MKIIRTSVVVAMLSTALIGMTGAQAAPAQSSIASGANATTALQAYQIELAAYRTATAAWNATRVQQVSTHLEARNAYSALSISNKTARLAIDSARVSAVTLANNVYAAVLLANPTASVKAAALKVRTAAIAAANAKAVAAIATLPVLGPKPIWPVAAPRPVKPVKPAVIAAP